MSQYSDGKYSSSESITALFLLLGFFLNLRMAERRRIMIDHWFRNTLCNTSDHISEMHRKKCLDYTIHALFWTLVLVKWLSTQKFVSDNDLIRRSCLWSDHVTCMWSQILKHPGMWERNMIITQQISLTNISTNNSCRGGDLL